MRVPVGGERRQFGRQLTYLHAIIRAPERLDVPCTVRNTSENGALLQVAKPHWLPSHFQLLMEANNTETDCEIVHLGVITVGVHFLSPPRQISPRARRLPRDV
jgi:hypothetical protein